MARIDRSPSTARQAGWSSRSSSSGGGVVRRLAAARIAARPRGSRTPRRTTDGPRGPTRPRRRSRRSPRRRRARPSPRRRRSTRIVLGPRARPSATRGRSAEAASGSNGAAELELDDVAADRPRGAARRAWPAAMSRPVGDERDLSHSSASLTYCVVTRSVRPVVAQAMELAPRSSGAGADRCRRSVRRGTGATGRGPARRRARAGAACRPTAGPRVGRGRPTARRAGGPRGSGDGGSATGCRTATRRSRRSRGPSGPDRA